jgi:hypothetical protein
MFCPSLPDHMTALHQKEDAMGKLTRLLLIATLLLTIVSLGLGACSWRTSEAAAPTNTPVPQVANPSATPAPATATPLPESTPDASVPSPPAQIILQNALDALAGLDSWHLEVDMPLIAKFRGLSIEVPVQYAGDFKAPGRLEGELSFQLLGLMVKKDVILQARTMVISDEAGGGRRISQRPASILYMMGIVGFQPGEMQNVEVVGTEMLEGVEVYHLTGSVPVEEIQFAQEGMDVLLEGELQFDLWIGVDDALPRQGMVGGELDVTGGAQATLQMVGLAALSDFGAPAIASEAETVLVGADGTRCGVDGRYVEYIDEERAISFCYPAGSVVDDVVDTCSPFVVSPEGVALGNELPGHMVLIYPDETVQKFAGSAAGAVEIAGRTTLCALRFMVSAVIGDGRSLVELYQATPTPTPTPAPGEKVQPLVIQFTGVQHGEAHAVSISYVLDEGKYGAAVGAVTGSIVVDKSAGP